MSLTDKMRHCHLTHSGLWAKLAAQNKADAGDVLPTAEQRVFSMAASCAVAPISRGNLGGPAAPALSGAPSLLLHLSAFPNTGSAEEVNPGASRNRSVRTCGVHAAPQRRTPWKWIPFSSHVVAGLCLERRSLPRARFSSL